MMLYLGEVYCNMSTQNQKQEEIILMKNLCRSLTTWIDLMFYIHAFLIIMDLSSLSFMQRMTSDCQSLMYPKIPACFIHWPFALRMCKKWHKSFYVKTWLFVIIEFKAVRAENEFFKVCRTPELACEVTLQVRL